MKKFFACVCASLIGVSMLSGCGGNKKEATESKTDGEKTKLVSAIFEGAINDGNWNETQYNGLKNIEEKGASIKYMENIGDAEVAEAARTYADEKFDLVYLTTNSYQEYCMPIAEQFPNTTFIMINGTVMTDNMISIRIADEEQGFMQGVIAALLSEKGKVGFIGGPEIVPIKVGLSGFNQGVAYVNETYGLSVEPVGVYTGDFMDVNKAKETAISLIESGCDVVAPMVNDASVGVMEAAEERGVIAIACGLGQEKSAPTMTRVTVVKDVAISYDVTYDQYINGKLGGDEIATYGVEQGVVYLTEWTGDVSEEIKTRVQETMEKLKKGEIKIDLNVD